jgi:hypothetical protein
MYGSPFFFFSDRHCTQLEFDLDPKSRHDAGLNIFPGIAWRAQSFSRWTDDLKIGSHMKPGKDLKVVK